MSVVTFSIRCDACGEDLGNGYTSKNESSVDAMLVHEDDHDADDRRDR